MSDEHQDDEVEPDPQEPAPEEDASDAGDFELPLQAWQVLALIVLAGGAIGFMTGTRGDQDPYRRGSEERADVGEHGEVPTYAAIRGNPLGPNRFRHGAAFERIASDRPDRADDREPGSDEAIAAELARRAELRAYDGAPPRIPHAIATRGPLDCVGCHQEGRRIGDRVAPPMSHATYTSCTQCHVPDEGQVPRSELRGGPPTDSTFVGMAVSARGPRMFDDAPPQMPHPTQMRERCSSCHGVWSEGIHTTHPARRSCTQCHTPNGAEEQGPRGGFPEGSGPPVAAMPGTP